MMEMLHQALKGNVVEKFGFIVLFARLCSIAPLRRVSVCMCVGLSMNVCVCFHYVNVNVEHACVCMHMFCVYVCV